MALLEGTKQSGVGGATVLARRLLAAVAADNGAPTTTNQGCGLKAHRRIKVVARCNVGGSYNLNAHWFDGTSEIWSSLDDDLGTVNVTPADSMERILSVSGSDAVYIRVFGHAGGATADVWVTLLDP